MTTSERIVKLTEAGAIRAAMGMPAEAFRMFERWCADHDPNGEMEMLDAALAYSAWANKNDVSIYTDAGRTALFRKDRTKRKSKITDRTRTE